MTVRDLIKHLERNGVRLSNRGDRLVVDAPRNVVTPELRRELSECKRAIMEALVTPSRVNARYEVPDGWRRDHWIDRLEYLASVCIHPGRAVELQEWANGLKRMEKNALE